MSSIAVATTSSPNISFHSLNGLFVVIIVDFFSYLLDINFKYNDIDDFIRQIFF
nr:hypothetical protein [Deferribacter desulfuricans]